MPLADGLALERDLMEELFRTDDAREGLTAFSEKRNAGVHRLMSTETITTYAGAFVDGAEHANSGDPLPDHQPRHRRGVRRGARRRRRLTSTPR